MVRLVSSRRSVRTSPSSSVARHRHGVAAHARAAGDQQLEAVVEHDRVDDQRAERGVGGGGDARAPGVDAVVVEVVAQLGGLEALHHLLHLERAPAFVSPGWRAARRSSRSTSCAVDAPGSGLEGDVGAVGQRQRGAQLGQLLHRDAVGGQRLVLAAERQQQLRGLRLEAQRRVLRARLLGRGERAARQLERVLAAAAGGVERAERALRPGAPAQVAGGAARRRSARTSSACAASRSARRRAAAAPRSA